MHTKWTARRLAADAMFAAMVTVLGLVSISTGNLKITVEALPVFLGALLLGPVDGLAIGGVGTLLYQLLRFGVSATTALWIAPYVLLGLCVGAVSARHGYDCTPRQLALLAVLGELGITVLNTGSLYLDSLIYGYYSPVFVFGTLPLRLAICAGKGIVLAQIASRTPTEDQKTAAPAGAAVFETVKKYYFLTRGVAVCCAQIPHLQPEKYFLRRTCRRRK